MPAIKQQSFFKKSTNDHIKLNLVYIKEKVINIKDDEIWKNIAAF